MRSLSAAVSAKRQGRKKYLKRKRPCVIDADALNYLAKHKNKLKRLRPDCVLTPHPAEMARLCDCSVAKIEENRFGAARDFAVAYNTTVLLKGNRTLIADPQGERLCQHERQFRACKRRKRRCSCWRYRLIACAGVRCRYGGASRHTFTAARRGDTLRKTEIRKQACSRPTCPAL